MKIWSALIILLGLSAPSCTFKDTAKDDAPRVPASATESPPAPGVREDPGLPKQKTP